jgi:hypothetical protein
MEAKERWTQTELGVSQDGGGEPGRWKAREIRREPERGPERETQGVSQDGGKREDWRIVNRSLMTNQKIK